MGSRSQQPSLPAKLTKTVTLPPLNSKDQSTKIKRRGVSAAKKKGELSTGVGASKTENSIKLNTPASVSKILTQKSSRQLCTGSMAKTGRPLTETKFLQKVRKIANEERANRLRWYILQKFIQMLTLSRVCNNHHPPVPSAYFSTIGSLSWAPRSPQLLRWRQYCKTGVWLINCIFNTTVINRRLVQSCCTHILNASTEEHGA